MTIIHKVKNGLIPQIINFPHICAWSISSRKQGTHLNYFLDQTFLERLRSMNQRKHYNMKVIANVKYETLEVGTERWGLLADKKTI